MPVYFDKFFYKTESEATFILTKPHPNPKRRHPFSVAKFDPKIFKCHAPIFSQAVITTLDFLYLKYHGLVDDVNQLDILKTLYNSSKLIFGNRLGGGVRHLDFN